MKYTDWLKNIFIATYYLMLLAWIIIFGMLLYALFVNSGEILEILGDGEEIKIKTENTLYTFIIYGLSSGAVWIYIFYLFKNLMQSLISGPLFTKLQITSFNLIGQLIIFLTIIDSIFLFTAKAIFFSRLQINFDLFDFWFVIAIGLFLIFLSNIFEKARVYKEENELTV